MPHNFDNQPAAGFEAIRLYPGAEMQIQSLDDISQARHRVRFIGFVKDMSLLVTLPCPDGKGMWVQAKQAFIVRGFNGKYAYAFTTQAIRAREHPFPYLHLAWPQMVEYQLVRNSLRVAVSLPASVLLADGSSVAVTVLDLSASGTMINSPAEIGAMGDRVRLVFAVDFEGSSMNLDASASIRKIHRKEGEAGFRTGLEFEDVSQGDSLVLHYFIGAVSQEKR